MTRVTTRTLVLLFIAFLALAAGAFNLRDRLTQKPVYTDGVLWRDVEVVRVGGPPQLRLHGGAARRFAAIGGRSSLLTITHSDELAMAQVLLLGD